MFVRTSQNRHDFIVRIASIKPRYTIIMFLKKYRLKIIEVRPVPEHQRRRTGGRAAAERLRGGRDQRRAEHQRAAEICSGGRLTTEGGALDDWRPDGIRGGASAARRCISDDGGQGRTASGAEIRPEVRRRRPCNVRRWVDNAPGVKK